MGIEAKAANETDTKEDLPKTKDVTHILVTMLIKTATTWVH